ncbi:hypothetical protein LF845_06115 [Deferribacterales bacterium Es71-Z0220]|uniref:hypothetical protein n=1 Tax=Deferrivibrio essentukiensis TaxID=2880922 RepID=UPI001F617A3B|nr:hypothetical protein [Deferrivibrio essentukiensis]MCB4204532.1 hypothetical protein [Deferrivibrio essentukiensis]
METIELNEKELELQAEHIDNRVEISLNDFWQKIEEDITKEEAEEQEEEKKYNFFEHLLGMLADNVNEDDNIRLRLNLPEEVKFSNDKDLYDNIKHFLIENNINDEQYKDYIEYAKTNLGLNLEKDFTKKNNVNMQIENVLEKVEKHTLNHLNINIHTSNPVVDLTVKATQLTLMLQFMQLMLFLKVLMEIKKEYDKKKQKEKFDKFKKATEMLEKTTKKHEKFILNLENPLIVKQIKNMHEIQKKQKNTLTFNDVLKHIHNNALLIKTDRQLKKEIKRFTNSNSVAKSKKINILQSLQKKQEKQQKQEKKVQKQQKQQKINIPKISFKLK